MAGDIKKAAGLDMAAMRLMTRATAIPFALPMASMIAERNGADPVQVVAFLANPTPHLDAYKDARAERAPAETFFGRLKERVAYASARSSDLTRESLLTNNLLAMEIAGPILISAFFESSSRGNVQPFFAGAAATRAK